jgi:hypothetical protein
MFAHYQINTYRMFHSKHNPTTITYYDTKMIWEAYPPHVIATPNLPSNTRVKVTLVARPLRKSSASANMVYSRAERVFILQHHFASKSFAAVREAFSCTHPDKEVSNKTAIHRLVTKFRDAVSVCLWQVLIERQNSWNYGRTDFKQCISRSYGIRLQKFNIAIGVVILCVKAFTCSSRGCVLNGTFCIYIGERHLSCWGKKINWGLQKTKF